MSKTLVAKPVVKGQYWVVTDGQHKVGNVIAEGSGYNLVLDGHVKHCANTTDIMREHSIQFERNNSRRRNDTPYAVWPTEGKTHNNMLDIKRRLHLYTKSRASKCYYAAGYFAIEMNGTWSTVFCPKYIFIQRYPYHGPFRTQDEAQQSITANATINTA